MATAAYRIRGLRFACTIIGPLNSGSFGTPDACGWMSRSNKLHEVTPVTGCELTFSTGLTQAPKNRASALAGEIVVIRLPLYRTQSNTVSGFTSQSAST